MAHECPECGDPCSCLPGDILERNCCCCDDVLDDEGDDIDEEDAY